MVICSYGDLAKSRFDAAREKIQNTLSFQWALLGGWRLYRKQLEYYYYLFFEPIFHNIYSMLSSAIYPQLLSLDAKVRMGVRNEESNTPLTAEALFADLFAGLILSDDLADIHISWNVPYPVSTYGENPHMDLIDAMTLFLLEGATYRERVFSHLKEGQAIPAYQYLWLRQRPDLFEGLDYGLTRDSVAVANDAADPWTFVFKKGQEALSVTLPEDIRGYYSE